LIFAVRITAGRKNQVLDKIVAMNKKENKGVYAVLCPASIKGYIFLEAENPDVAAEAVYGVPYVKGLVKGTLTLKDVEKFLEPGKQPINIKKNDIVELISGPFKGEKARVNRVNKAKDEVVVELLEAAVSIPTTVKLDSVRLIQHKEGEEE